MTPLVLAVDTTSELGSLALVEGGKLLAQSALRSADGYGHLIFQAVEALLADCRRGLSQVDCFAAAAGPGSFTGIRVGLAAMQGLADALSKPAIAVSTLRAEAWHGSANLRAAAIDARRGEIYGRLYTGSLDAAGRETVMDPGAWLDSLPETALEFLCRDARAAEALAAARPSISSFLCVVPAELAGSVGRIAAAVLVAGHVPKAPLEANYVRASDAEMYWREW